MIPDVPMTGNTSGLISLYENVTLANLALHLTQVLCRSLKSNGITFFSAEYPSLEELRVIGATYGLRDEHVLTHLEYYRFLDDNQLAWIPESIFKSSKLHTLYVQLVQCFNTKSSKH